MSRILLVEDDIDVRLVMENALLDEGYEVDTTGTASGALELLGCRDYDLVLTDGRLQDGTGMQVADKARTKNTPALIVTGYGFDLDDPQLGGYEFLAKPVRPSELLVAICRRLRRMK